MSEPEVAPPAQGRRIDWPDLPEWLRDELEDLLGAPVTEALTRPSGFSPGAAARLRLTNDTRAFVKAVSTQANPDAPGIYQAEIQVAAALPASAPAPGC
ncbi:hypothetical protein GCM10027589_16780 [Actinocorallia lasiicapitis]